MGFNPPSTNGVAEFTVQFQADGTANPAYDAAKVSAAKTKLQAIVNGFTPTDFQATPDTFYIVSTYNEQNPTAPLNGDTAQAILNPPSQGV